MRNKFLQKTARGRWIDVWKSIHQAERRSFFFFVKPRKISRSRNINLENYLYLEEGAFVIGVGLFNKEQYFTLQTASFML